MIFDSIKNKDNYKESALLYQALNYLAELTPETAPTATVELIPGVLFCNPVSFTSKPESECIYEAHRKYADLHYILEGVEGIATADTDSLEIHTPYSEEKDILFLNGPEDGRYYLKAGQFMVCYPNDAHKVAMCQDTPAPIKKIVFKIAVS